jgi:hypothetical protein
LNESLAISYRLSLSSSSFCLLGHYLLLNFGFTWFDPPL